jgi:ammonia channel protein AmtB
MLLDFGLRCPSATCSNQSLLLLVLLLLLQFSLTVFTAAAAAAAAAVQRRQCPCSRHTHRAGLHQHAGRCRLCHMQTHQQTLPLLLLLLLLPPLLLLLLLLQFNADSALAAGTLTALAFINTLAAA